jgi:16S rRNA (guanine527-N7)-methyltransferase
VDGSVTRAAFLTEAAAELGVDERVSVLAERAEEAGRGPWRGRADLVVARGFGPPAVTAECAAPFLAVGGRLVVAEPPGGRPDRWTTEGAALLGMAIGPAYQEPTALQVLVQASPCPDRYPRRTGIPAKRRLF